MNEPRIPVAFIEQLVRREGTAGKAWLDSLPELAGRYLREWALTLDGTPMHGTTGVLLPVSHGGRPAVLKLSWLDEETRHEPLALSTWNGAGAVLLLESDPAQGVMVLERLDSERMLEGEPLDFAVETAGRLMRRLAVPAPPGLGRTLRGEATRWARELPGTWERLGRPLPRVMLDTAIDICRALGPKADSLLVNEDLHYSNVLAGTREPWLVIDPKPLTGDVEFAVIPLLWNRIEESSVDERFAAVVAAAELDAARARAWTLVRAVVNWLWAAEVPDAEFVEALSRIAHWAC